MSEISAREIKWLNERKSRFTSSAISKLFMGGKAVKGKGKAKFGVTAMGYIDDIVYQMISGRLIDYVDAWQMKFGSENEPVAIEWARENSGMYDIVSGTDDGEEISFRKVGDYFGDSADGFVLMNGEEIAWLEIKCPANGKKAWQLTRPDVTKEEVFNEYRYQLACHFLANPHLNEGWYLIYDAHQNAEGVYANHGKIFKYTRADFGTLIEECDTMMKSLYPFVLLCAEGKETSTRLNEWWEENN